MASVFFPDDEEWWYDSDDSQNDLDGSLPSFASMSELTGTTWAENYQNFDMEEPSYDKKKLLHTTEEDIYIARQRYGYCSVGISLFQIIYLVFVICLCGGLAPLKINPNIGPYPDGLNHSGAKNAFQIVYEREYWRLITPTFLHSGLVHLFCNISVQLETGSFFEREWGSTIWLTVFIISAVGSTILSVDSMPNTISVGSSGAVMGLFGAKISEVCCRACESRRRKQNEIAHEVRMEQLPGMLCSVTIVGLLSFLPYVDWAANLGGLISGLLIGLVLFSGQIRSISVGRFLFTAGIFLMTNAFIIGSYYMFQFVEPKGELQDICSFYANFFNGYECHC